MDSNPKIPFKDYTPRTHATSTLNDAMEELRREMGVRKRLYDKWYADGNITFAEGDSRMRGLMSALALLIQMSKTLDGTFVAEATPSGPF